MFKFLKDKLKGAVDKFSKQADEEADYVEIAGAVDSEPIEESKDLEVQDDYIVLGEGKEDISESANDDELVSMPGVVEEERPVEEVTEIPTIAEVEKEEEFVPIAEVAQEKPAEELVADVVEPLIEEKKEEIIVDDGFVPVSEVVGAEKAEVVDIAQVVETHPSAEDLVADVSCDDEVKVVEDDLDVADDNVLEDLGIVVKEPEPVFEVKEQESVAETEEEKAFLEDESAVQEVEETKPVEAEEEKPKMGFFKKLLSKKITEDTFEDLFFDLEVTLLENNVATEVIDKIRENLKEELVNTTAPRGSVSERVSSTLENTLKEVMSVGGKDLLEMCSEKKPLVVCFFGINGAGKTTSIGKLTRYFQRNDKSVVLAAADTFRAAAIDQLQEHADALGVKMIKHDYGSDPAAVAYDAIEHAKSKGIDAVFIDTAGRLHNNSNLMQEMEKIIRVAKPDVKIFVGESITGNDCVEQAKKFDEIVGIDGIILSKADIDEKGGAALSISYVTGKPILYLGMGQGYDDLERYDRDKMLKNLI